MKKLWYYSGNLYSLDFCILAEKSEKIDGKNDKEKACEIIFSQALLCSHIHFTLWNHYPAGNHDSTNPGFLFYSQFPALSISGSLNFRGLCYHLSK